MISIVLADDHRIVREGMRRLVEDQGDMRVVGEVESGAELMDLVQGDADADVVLLDVTMPGPGYLQLLRWLRRNSAAAVLVVSARPESAYALRAFRVGARGYVAKHRSPEELIEAIRRVAAGGRHVSPELAELLAFEGLAEEAPPHERLSEREFEVLKMLARGARNRDVARGLSLSPKTVSTYRARILDKLGLDGTAALVRYAIEHDLVE